MPSSYDRSILLDLGVFSADNKYRRNIGAFGFNYLSSDAKIGSLQATLVPSASYTWSLGTTLTKVVVVTVDGTFTNKTTAVVTTRTGPSTTVTNTIAVTKLLVLDDDVQQIVFTNTDTTNAVRLALYYC